MVFKHSADIGYQDLTSKLKTLADQYNCELITIGHSVLGAELWTVRLGMGARSIYLNGAHHGCEWLTAPLLLEFVQKVLEAQKSGSLLEGVDVQTILKRVSIWVTPLVNPDGVTLAKEGLKGIPRDFHHALKKWNYGRNDFKEWKANIRGVDLNRQYRADWRQAYQDGPKTPGPQYYAGESPESEPESRAVANFTRRLSPEFVLTYHSQGEVIYWNYRHLAPPESRRIARELSRLSGYALLSSNPGQAGSGGYKDWFIKEFRRPGFTIEVGRGVNPLPVSQFPTIWAKNVPLLANLATFIL